MEGRFDAAISRPFPTFELFSPSVTLSLKRRNVLGNEGTSDNQELEALSRQKEWGTECRLFYFDPPSKYLQEIDFYLLKNNDFNLSSSFFCCYNVD